MFKKLFGPEIKKSFIIYSGEEKHRHHGITFLPWQELLHQNHIPLEIFLR
jgi:hypothetical protein